MTFVFYVWCMYVFIRQREKVRGFELSSQPEQQTDRRKEAGGSGGAGANRSSAPPRQSPSQLWSALLFFVGAFKQLKVTLGC
jgi:hypothetical protein